MFRRSGVGIKETQLCDMEQVGWGRLLVMSKML